MKLLDSPRIQKEITVPKKKVRRVKKEKSEGESNVKFLVLREGDKKRVDDLIKLYKADPYKARVKFFTGNRNTYQFSRLILFEYDKGDFEVVNFTNTFGISVTNKMYSSQKKESSLIYRNKKFWFRQHGKIKPLMFLDFRNFILKHENIGDTWSSFNFSKTDKFDDSKIFQYFQSRFHWIKTLSEYKHNFLITFNSIVDKKLYGFKEMNRYLFKVPYNISKLVENSQYMSLIKKEGKPFAVWQETIKVLDHIDHLRQDMLACEYFRDTCKMARTLGKKVNCKWGLTRLKQEHDQWAREITRVLLDSVDEYELNIKPEYKAFAKFSGFKLLKTNKDMLIEGMLQNHCVGTYINKVDKGECAIFHVDGYTLQVGIETETKFIREIPETSLFGDNNILMPVTKGIEVKKFKNLQFKGRHNQNAPSELVEGVAEIMENFAKSGGFEDIAEENKTYEPLTINRGTVIDVMGFGRMAYDNEVLPF